MIRGDPLRRTYTEAPPAAYLALSRGQSAAPSLFAFGVSAGATASAGAGRSVTAGGSAGLVPTLASPALELEHTGPATHPPTSLNAPRVRAFGSFAAPSPSFPAL